MSYRRFFLIRLGQALFAIWLVATLVFVMFFVLLSKPARNLAGGKQATPSTIERVSDELHLDAPLYEQYASYMWRLFAHQTAGDSPAFANPNARERFPDTGAIARHAIPPTLSVVILTLIVSLGVGGLAGFALARTRWRWVYGLPIYVAVGLLPVWVGIELSYYLGVRWDVVPIGNYCNFFASEGTGCSGPVNWIKHLILPVVTLSLALAAVYTRMIRAVLLRATSDRERRRGLRALSRAGRRVRFRRADRALVVRRGDLPDTGTGEADADRAIGAQDLVLMQSVVLYAAFLGIAASFLVDALVAALDPEVRDEWRFVARPKRAT